MGIGGERVVKVASLDPATTASELFVQRAKAADLEFELDGDGPFIRDICARVDGIPLAIELAAAQMSSMSPSELLERLHDRFRLLRGSSRGGIDRHQTLRDGFLVVSAARSRRTPGLRTVVGVR